jgi:uncharacterized NAD-dependent epimerase/dehydratase family protein
MKALLATFPKQDHRKSTPALKGTVKKINKKLFKTLANWKIVSIFAARFSGEKVKGLRNKQIDGYIKLQDNQR